MAWVSGRSMTQKPTTLVSTKRNHAALTADIWNGVQVGNLFFMCVVQVLDGARACPPEDSCGCNGMGVHSYKEFLESWEDAKSSGTRESQRKLRKLQADASRALNYKDRSAVLPFHCLPQLDFVLCRQLSCMHVQLCSFLQLSISAQSFWTGC